MLFSRQDLSKLIIPLFLQQMLAVTVGMLDSVMVSSAGEAAVSGVSLVDSVNLLLVYAFSALASGGAITISQALGAKQHSRTSTAAKQLIWVVFVVSCIIAMIAAIFRQDLLTLIYGNIPADIRESAQAYFFYTAISYPFLALHSACASIYRAAGQSQITLITSIIINFLNLGGNALLIYQFNMGAAGAAIATLISRIVGAAIMMVCICGKNSPIPIHKLFSFRPHWQLIGQICKIGIPNGIENSIFQLGKLMTQSLIVTFGTIEIAANAAANPLTSMQYIPGGAIGMAMTVIVGRCIGAGEHRQARYYTKVLMGICYASILIMSIPMCIFSKELVGLYNLSDASSTLCIQLVLFHSLCVCTVWPLAFTLANSFRAASDVRYPMIISVCSMWIFRVGLSYVFGKILGLELIGVWLALACDWIFRAIIFTVHYIRGKWLTVYKAVT